MNDSQVTEFYAKKTGLSKAKVKRYRDQPVSSWTTRADRKIGGTLRWLDRLADDPNLSWDDWRKQGAVLLLAIHEWVDGILATVADFAERISDAIERVLRALKPVLGPLSTILVALGALAAS